MTEMQRKVSRGTAVSFFLNAIIVGTATFFLADQFAIHHFWLAVLSVLVFSIPIGLGATYSVTVDKIRRLHIFNKRGLLYWFYSRRIIIVTFLVCWSLVSSLFMLVLFRSYSAHQWIVLSLVIPVFFIVFKLSYKFLSLELRAYILNHMALKWARLIAPLFMVMIYLVSILLFDKSPDFISLSEAIENKQASVVDITASVVVLQAAQIVALYQGIEAYLIELLGSLNHLWRIALLALGSYLIFYNACMILSCFLIPKVEYRRVFGPLTDDDVPTPPSSSRVATITGTITFCALFIYLPFFSYLENEINQKELDFDKIKTAATELVEKIGDEFYKEGTIEKINVAKIEGMRRIEPSLDDFGQTVDRAFGQLENNVDNFLDWYYSLAGEYTRIGYLLTNRLEKNIAQKLLESLEQGDPFGPVQAKFSNVLSQDEETQREYLEKVQKILEENRIDPSASRIQVGQSISLQEVLSPPIHQDVVSLQSRLKAGGGVGAAATVTTAVVARQVVLRVVGRNTLRFAARALAKTVTSKATTTGLGALGGSAVGSVFPGIGTVGGVIIGGAAGLAAGVSVDKLTLVLEEHISRKEFREAIIASIHDARRDFEVMLYGYEYDLVVPTENFQN